VVIGICSYELCNRGFLLGVFFIIVFVFIFVVLVFVLFRFLLVGGFRVLDFEQVPDLDGLVIAAGDDHVWRLEAESCRRDETTVATDVVQSSLGLFLETHVPDLRLDQEYLDRRVLVAHVQQMVEVVVREVHLDYAVLVSGQRKLLQLRVDRDVLARVEVLTQEVVHCVQIDKAVVRAEAHFSLPSTILLNWMHEIDPV
jgi:hypothetical protein